MHGALQPIARQTYARRAASLLCMRSLLQACRMPQERRHKLSGCRSCGSSDAEAARSLGGVLRPGGEIGHGRVSGSMRAIGAWRPGCGA